MRHFNPLTAFTEPFTWISLEEENAGCLHRILRFGCLGSRPRQLSWDSGKGLPEVPWGIMATASPSPGGDAFKLRLHHLGPSRATTTTVSWTSLGLATAPDVLLDYICRLTCMLSGVI